MSYAKTILKTCLWVVLFSFSSMTLIQADDYRLKPGDQVEVRIIGKSDLTTRQPLTPDGTLSLPAIGRVTLEGKTLAESDALLTTKFATLIKNPQVVTILHKAEDPKPKSTEPIYISLNDLSKNSVEVKKTESAAEALAYTANHVYIVKRNTENLGPTTNLLPGDIVSVEIGKRPDFIEDNWYKLLSGAALALGIFNSLR